MIGSECTIKSFNLLSNKVLIGLKAQSAFIFSLKAIKCFSILVKLLLNFVNINEWLAEILFFPEPAVCRQFRQFGNENCWFWFCKTQAWKSAIADSMFHSSFCSTRSYKSNNYENWIWWVMRLMESWSYHGK